MKITNPTRALTDVFTPPFRGLAIVAWIYFALSFLVFPDSPLLKGALADPDDYTILTHTLDWLKGQSWYDLTQHRMNPPEGVPLHFSRLAEIPLAVLILPLHALGLSWTGAATLTAILWPLALLAGLFAAVNWTAKSFLPPDWTRATAYVTLFALPLTFHFMPGRVDHHGLVALLTFLAFGSVLRMMKEPEVLKWGLLGGFLLALGQTIALEILPWLLLLSGWIGIGIIINGRATARSGLVFGLTLYVTSALTLLATRPPEAWLTPDVLTYSVVYVFLAGIIAACCAGLALAAQKFPIKPRAAAGAALALAGVVLFLSRFPEWLTGPYGAMNKELAKIMFDNIVEMQPLAMSPRHPDATLLMLAGLFACAGLCPSKRDKNRDLPWILLSLLLLTAFLLASFYQVRFARYAILFGIIPLTVFLKRSLSWAKTQFRGRKLAAVEWGLILLVGPLPAVLLPAVIDGRPFNTGVLLFPAQHHKGGCEVPALAAALNDPASLGGKQRIIMNTLNEGSAILFHSGHKVLAAPYHTNVSGMLDAKRFFTTSDPAEAKKILRARGAEIIVICAPLPTLYRTRPSEKPAKTAKELAPNATFAEQLAAGKLPNWLEPVKIKDSETALLFKTKKE